MRIAIRVTPRAKRNVLKRMSDGSFKAYLTAPPVEGKANAALIQFLAKEWGIKPSTITLVSGFTNRDKIIEAPIGQNLSLL